MVATLGRRPCWRRGFSNQTLRMILRPSIAGNRLRLRLCNTYNAWPQQLGEARISIRRSGPDIREGSDRAVSFGGGRTATIPAGAVAVSDPVPLKVTGGEDLAVDLYFPHSTGPPTWHAEANRTSYVLLPGDHAGAPSWAHPMPVRCWFFVCGLDVPVDDGAAAVVALGDSITDGAGSTPEAAADWPEALAQRLAASGVRNIAVVNRYLRQLPAVEAALRRRERARPL
jgi:hypothetical protein